MESMASGTKIQTTSSSSLNSYSPIATLERQYAGPLGQRLIIGVQANAACFLEGGVESILKLKGNSNALSSEGMVTSPDEPNARFDESKDDEFDAFGFLRDSNASAKNNNPTEAGKKNRIGGFIRKVAASTSATLERQMQSMAVRIDKGRNSDLLRVAMYDPHTEELLAVTEPLPLEERQDLRFRVPLMVVGRRRQQQFRLKLWIQSGAALLQSTKAAKHYLLGQATVDATKLVLGTVAPISLSSNLVVGAQLHLCALPDAKFSQVLQRGWSLTDPDSSAYSSDLCYLPLDQSYIFNGKKPEHWLVATERATESTIPLPIAAACMELAARATQKSLHHAQSVAKVLRQNRHDFKDDSTATCLVGITGVQSATGTTSATMAYLSVAWRRPDSIFELELVANQQVPVSASPMGNLPVQLKLFPKVCTDGVLPGILQAFGGQMPASGFLLGALYFCVTLTDSNQANDNQVQVWETVVGMEGFIDTGNNNSMIQLPLHKNGQPMGHLLAQIQVTMPAQRDSYKQYPATDGLVSLVGLDSRAFGLNPGMDNDVSTEGVQENSNGADSLRKQQLDTMGFFFTTQYMEQHLALRQTAMEGFQERARLYKQALVQPDKSEPYETKTPKAFRPSSSRMETQLSALPFNCHVVQMNINVVDAMRTTEEQREYPGACFTNITHGAPSDHARGFGNILAGISNAANAAGGLRRLESKRREFGQTLQQAQNQLIAGVGNFLAMARQNGGNVNHIPARHADLQRLRYVRKYFARKTL
jgi:hypothetical protein